jgi:hypothetical protein
MNSTNPVEYLIAFGATFLGGVIATVALQQYVKYIKNNKETS